MAASRLLFATAILCVSPRTSAGQDMETEPTFHGICLESIGDLDGDAVPDVIAGAGLDDGGHGLVVALSGRDLHELYTLKGADREGLGFSLSQLADQDQDGVPELVVGAPFFGEQRGRVEVRSGASGRLLWGLDGTYERERFGYAVEAISDVSLDGRDDLAIGAPGLHPEASGFGRTYFASEGGALVSWIDGRHGGDRFGNSLQRCGDVDGDGRDDLAVGSWRGDYVLVVSPQAGSVISTSEGDTRWDWYGWDLASASDLNGDGHGDLLVAARAGVQERLRLVSAATGETLQSATCGSSCGASVSRLLDIDGDGAIDFAVGDPGFPLHVRGPMGISLGTLAARARVDAKKPGSVSLVSGRDLTVLATLQGWEGDDWFGSDTALGPDADQDGVRDLVVAAGLGSPFQVALYSLDGRMIAGAKFGTPSSASPIASPSGGGTRRIPWLLAGLAAGAVLAILLAKRSRRPGSATLKGSDLRKVSGPTAGP